MNNNSKNRMLSVVSYPERGSGGSNRYRGNCSPKLIEDLISQFGVKHICDYMAGSNTTKDAAQHMGISSSTYDLNSGFDLLNHEIQERSEFTFWHPPYWTMITYSDVMYSAQEVKDRYGFDPRAVDLSRIESWDTFVKAMNHCMMKQFCALEKGGRMAVLVGDIKQRGRLYSMIFELIKPGLLENVVIKMQHNCMSDNIRYTGNFIPIVHEYLLILRKAAPLTYPILVTCATEVDIRDMPGATWKDVVADALAHCGGHAGLEELYAEVGNYKRAAKNKFWKEKVRQTLQYYPKLFSSSGRGSWELMKAV